MPVTELKLYKILREKMGEEEAQSLVEYVEAKIEAEFQDKQYVLATKQDLLMQKNELLDRMNMQKDELMDRMDQQKQGLDRRFDAMDQNFNDFKVQVKSDKVDIIKWMFIFWVGQLAAILALFKFFIPGV